MTLKACRHELKYSLNHRLHGCIWFAWQGFGSRGAAGEAQGFCEKVLGASSAGGMPDRDGPAAGQG